LITFGVAPIALADASGANNIDRLTFDATLADACGFTQQDLSKGLVTTTAIASTIPVEKMLQHHTHPFLHEEIPNGSRISRVCAELEEGKPRSIGRPTKSEFSSSFLFSRLALTLHSHTTHTQIQSSFSLTHTLLCSLTIGYQYTAK
jgi:hypothetical protein